MYTKINMPNGLNSGSCKALVEYLDKEEKGFFFDKHNEKAPKERVQKEIDNNVSKLTKTEDKFYMLSFSPSQYELKSMVGKEVSDINDLNFEEKTKLYNDLRNYTHNAMDIYAQNFDRDNVKSGQDLVYFARIETERTHNHFDKEVKEGKAKVGQKKEGLQFHVHVIVSRKSADGKVKLSPNTRFRGAKWDKNGTQITRGFNYTNFTQSCSRQFTTQFNIPTRQSHSKGTSNVNAGINKATGAIKGQAVKHVNQLLGENLKIERATLSKVKQVVSVAKSVSTIATAVTAGTNPVSATKAAIDLAVKAGKAIHAAAGM
jgi:hypothetical protein